MCSGKLPRMIFGCSVEGMGHKHVERLTSGGHFFFVRGGSDGKDGDCCLELRRESTCHK